MLKIVKMEWYIYSRVDQDGRMGHLMNDGYKIIFSYVFGDYEMVQIMSIIGVFKGK